MCEVLDGSLLDCGLRRQENQYPESQETLLKWLAGCIWADGKCLFMIPCSQFWRVWLLLPESLVVLDGHGSFVCPNLM